MGDYGREQGKPLLFRSAASVLHKCVYRKNIKSTMGNSLPFPKLINFSTCWQISAWTGMEFERWMCKSTAGGKWVCLAQLLFRAFPILSGYLGPASVTEQDSRASVIPGLGSHSVACLCLLTVQGPSGSADGKSDGPVAIAGTDRVERPVSLCCVWKLLFLPLHLEFDCCILWAPLPHLLTW